MEVIIIWNINRTFFMQTYFESWLSNTNVELSGEGGATEAEFVSKTALYLNVSSIYGSSLIEVIE